MDSSLVFSYLPIKEIGQYQLFQELEIELTRPIGSNIDCC